MVQSCSVNNCDTKSIKGNGIKFHGLPFDNPELYQKWLIALKIDTWTPTKFFKVCSKHFREDNYKKSESDDSLVLLNDAVPSIFLDSSKLKKNYSKKKKTSALENMNINPLQKRSNKTLPATVNKRARQSICFVPNCKAPNDLPVYNLPFNDKYLLNIWIKRIGLSTIYDLDLYSTVTICKNHFHESCFDEISMSLKHNAIPSLNLKDYLGPPEDCCLYTEENSIMTSTGDHTWGWLGSTEQFGRDTDPNEFVVIPKSQMYDDKYKQSTQAAHCVIFAYNNEKVFGIYNSRAAILMQLRYDGYFGFPGGLVDSGEDFLNALNRELVEEMNLDTAIHSVNHDDYVISHWSEKKQIALHFYQLKVTMAELIEIEKRALLARDYGSEVLGTIRVPLYTLGDHYRGFPVFLKNNFIGCSRDQLLAVISSLNIMTHEEIQLALNATNKNIYE